MEEGVGPCLQFVSLPSRHRNCLFHGSADRKIANVDHGRPGCPNGTLAPSDKITVVSRERRWRAWVYIMISWSVDPLVCYTASRTRSGEEFWGIERMLIGVSADSAR
jgi:hypothetical protein